MLRQSVFASAAALLLASALANPGDQIAPAGGVVIDGGLGVYRLTIPEGWKWRLGTPRDGVAPVIIASAGAETNFTADTPLGEATCLYMGGPADPAYPSQADANADTQESFKMELDELKELALSADQRDASFVEVDGHAGVDVVAKLFAKPMPSDASITQLVGETFLQLPDKSAVFICYGRIDPKSGPATAQPIVERLGTLVRSLRPY